LAGVGTTAEITLTAKNLSYTNGGLAVLQLHMRSSHSVRSFSMGNASTAQPLRASRRLRDLPTPPGEWPVLGHLARVKPLVAHTQFEEWGRKLGMPYRLQLGPTPVVVLDDVSSTTVSCASDRSGGCETGRILPVSRELGLDGLFSVEGDQWMVQRRLIMQALNASHFRGFFPILRAVTERLHRRWYAPRRAARRSRWTTS
jgi:cytochrome P450